MTTDSALPVIAYVDTTSPILHLAVSDGSQMLAQRAIESTSRRYHSAVLIPEFRDLLNSIDLQVNQINAMVVNTGPGSFTGLRTGLAAARTMGQWLDINMIPLTSFQVWALAAEQAGYASPVAFYGDALRGRAYYSVIHAHSDTYKLETLVEPELVSPESPSQHAVPVATVLMNDKTIPYWQEALGEKAIESLESLTTERPMPSVVHQALMTLNQPVDKTHPWVKSWDKVLPLYIQRPNITTKKPKKTRNLDSVVK
jgi:tRNA threonylcarbamoyl adenosine modification protein YeaZ